MAQVGPKKGTFQKILKGNFRKFFCFLYYLFTIIYCKRLIQINFWLKLIKFFWNSNLEVIWSKTWGCKGGKERKLYSDRKEAQPVDINRGWGPVADATELTLVDIKISLLFHTDSFWNDQLFYHDVDSLSPVARTS